MIATIGKHTETAKGRKEDILSDDRRDVDLIYNAKNLLSGCARAMRANLNPATGREFQNYGNLKNKADILTEPRTPPQYCCFCCLDDFGVFGPCADNSDNHC